MKRYRIIVFDFDSRAHLLATEINQDWELEVKEGHERNIEKIKEWLVQAYGPLYIEAKIQNYIDFGDIPFSVLSYHNKFFHQIRNSFVIGSYYPALTGACALGERILNHLLLGLRESFTLTPEYKNVFKKKSFDDWSIVINTLDAWKVLLPDAVQNFKKLQSIRNSSIHFNKETDFKDREFALEAAKTLGKIISVQFAGLGGQPWFIENVPGASFVKKDCEQDPFVKLIYLPNAAYVGPEHWMEYENGWTVYDSEHYVDKDITDQEFVSLYQKATHQRIHQKTS